MLHLLALHEVGSNNPDGVEIKENKDENGIPKDGIPFHPFYTVHDLVGISVFLFVCVMVDKTNAILNFFDVGCRAIALPTRYSLIYRNAIFR